MEESGFGTQIGAAILILVLLISATILLYSIKSVREGLMSAWRGEGDRISNTNQTDIDIENALYDNTPPGENRLRVIVKNTGSTLLSVSAVDLLVDNYGIISRVNIQSENVENVVTDVWAPREDLWILTEDIFPSKPNRAKVVTEYGVSDYTENIENVAGF